MLEALSHTHTYKIRWNNKFINDEVIKYKEYNAMRIVYLYINIKYYNEEWKERLYRRYLKNFQFFLLSWVRECKEVCVGVYVTGWLQMKRQKRGKN